MNERQANFPMRDLVNLADYLEAALSAAVYERRPGEAYHGTIPSLPDVWADAPTFDECQATLRDTLEDWMRERLAGDLDLPEINGNMPLVSTSYCPWHA